MSKIIWDCVGFALLRSMIGSENSRYSLDRSDVKLKPMTTESRAFSRALRSLLVSFFGSYWFSRYSLFPDGPFRKLWLLFYENHLKRAQIAEVNKTKYT